MRLFTSRDKAVFGGKFTSWVDVVRLPLNSASSVPKSCHTYRMISSMPPRWAAVKTRRLSVRMSFIHP